jgi:serine/threonine protein kinase
MNPLSCPSCGEALTLPYDTLGRGTLCPHCRSTLLGPTPLPQTSQPVNDDPNATRAWSHASAEPLWPEGLSIPGYEIQGELGRGGMGVVYLARQVALDRLVALKMIRSGACASPEELARFTAEARTVARLRHANIVQIYEVGEHGGVPYFSLEYIDGGSLDKKLAAASLPPRDAARLLESLAEAVDAAHQAGIVHRDLKPANILLTRDGQAKVTDFGLAKQVNADVVLTHSGAVLGTPSYMAPEQAAGKVKEIGPATDVYALGAILYEVLTGQPPFRGPTPLEIWARVIAEDPLPPSALRAGVSRALEAICLHCLAKEPECRYSTAAELADDLGRFLAGEPISLRPAGPTDRLRRVLSQSRLRDEFAVWGNLLLLFAGVFFLGHLVLAYSCRARLPMSWIVATDCAQFTLMGVALAVIRAGRRAPLSAEEHRLSLWVIGYMMACALVRLVNQRVFGIEALYAGLDYPYWSVLAALWLFLVAGLYWGRLYVFSVAFGLLAMVISLWPPIAIVGFGTLWAACLGSLGWHLRRIGRQGDRPRNANSE